MIGNISKAGPKGIQYYATKKSVGDLSQLDTNSKESIVSAINEVNTLDIHNKLKNLAEYELTYIDDTLIASGNYDFDKFPLGLYIFSPVKDVDSVFLNSADGLEPAYYISEGKLLAGNAYIIDFQPGESKLIGVLDTGSKHDWFFDTGNNIGDSHTLGEIEGMIKENLGQAESNAERITALEKNGVSSDGTPGTAGKSAYEIALDNGFEGSEAEWLASLVGEDGTDGTNGVDGQDGDDGVGISKIEKTSTSGKVDTYTITLTNGNTSTFTVTNGTDGEDGTNGTNGVNGADGQDGVSATHSWNGTTLTITSASGTSSVDLKGDKGEQGIQGEKGDTGAAGEDGYTPVKGVDYFTESDKAEIVVSVIESLGGNPVFGYVDANNNIVVSGNLADGTYSVKYEMEDESTIDIGELVLDSNVYHSISNNLTNCTNSNTATEVVEGSAYSATISANSGYEITSIIVTMGGTDITSSAVSNGVISISSVTGNIVITAVAEEVTTAEPKNFFNVNEGEAGRIGSDGLKRTDNDTCFITNYIEVQNGDIIKVSGCDITGTVPATSNSYFMACYDSSKAKLYASGADKTTGTYFTLDSDTDTESQITITNDSVKYVRFTCTNPSGSSTKVVTDDIIINIKRNGEWLTE